MQTLKKLWAFVRHNSGMFIGGAICLMVLIWTYGCESQVRSITNPIILVNRGQLEIEVDTFIAQAELRFADLDKQDAVKSTLFNTAIDFMQGGKINPVAVALVISSILGLGAGADNIRKRTHINTLKSNNAS
ncbi:unnamed protein product [marine sediment metagenome]|uniref:Uncharacterized protein n=1 Tax=marine sediment metagenome TaxID=412755 RepID=X1QKP2_9ZZZZ